jgi:hypothetical protein
MVSCSSRPGPSGFKKRKYITLSNAGEDAISDMLNDELIIGSDDEMHLEIEGETVIQELGYAMMTVVTIHTITEEQKAVDSDTS